MDVARWMLGEPGLPPSVMSVGGRFVYQDDAETPNTLISVYHYEKAPLIFEVRGLPMKAGMRAMGRYRAAQVGVVLQCEGGYAHVSEGGNVTRYDNDNKKVQFLANAGNISNVHRASFVKAVQNRKVIDGALIESHLSTSLCHLGNISHLLGAERSNSVIGEAVRSNEPTQEAFGRMLEHLKANDINVDATKAKLGPLLAIDGAKEKIVGKETKIVEAANRSLLMKREGRAPFLVPDFQKET